MRNFLSLLLTFVFTISSITCVLASDNPNSNYTDTGALSTSTGSNSFAPIEFGPQTPSGGIVNVVNKIIGTMKWLGYAIAVGMLIYIGIKYVMASADGKADLKSALIKYTIGAFVIVFSLTIADWVFNGIL